MIDYRLIAAKVLEELKVPRCLISPDGPWIRCDHPQKSVRRRPIKGGSFAFYQQCHQCGQSVGNCVSPSRLMSSGQGPAGEWNRQLEEWFCQLREAFAKLYRQRQEEAKTKEESDWQELYRRHVNPQNPGWMELRRKVLERCKGVCEGCGVRQVVQVHHTTYDHLGDELLFELRGVCLVCHAKLHPHRFGG